MSILTIVEYTIPVIISLIPLLTGIAFIKLNNLNWDGTPKPMKVSEIDSTLLMKHLRSYEHWTTIDYFIDDLIESYNINIDDKNEDGESLEEIVGNFIRLNYKCGKIAMREIPDHCRRAGAYPTSVKYNVFKAVSLETLRLERQHRKFHTA